MYLTQTMSDFKDGYERALDDLGIIHGKDAEDFLDKMERANSGEFNHKVDTESFKKTIEVVKAAIKYDNKKPDFSQWVNFGYGCFIGSLITMVLILIACVISIYT